ncbi:hypothetical protein [Butyrivibrio sp. M55]|uniref:hypothetical protein n=1 Tax=Butyrivibrio sp. M55 TaxID=1855323 RepID=UPI0008E7DB63|nr:hypothetical protein [Butyrivibrio sp. M55]SFU91002.1 hypothetical protein SAMN05216540_12028 [Butyrivibrio sp. M55]
MKKEVRTAIIVTIAGVVVVLGFSIYTVLSGKDEEVAGEESDINISVQGSMEASVPDEFYEGDRLLENERGQITGYIDDQDVLMSKDMMSTRNHILFTEALTNFLNNSGYPSERIIIIPESAGSEGSVSHFTASVDGYDDITLYIESYNTIDAFSFVLLKGDVVVASSRDDYQKETESYIKGLEENYREAATSLSTEITLDVDDDTCR